VLLLAYPRGLRSVFSEVRRSVARRTRWVLGCYCLSHYAMLAPYQLVGEAPRPLVADEGSAVLLCLALESVDTDRQRIGMRTLATTIDRGLT
jgi:hypothetical protein